MGLFEHEVYPANMKLNEADYHEHPLMLDKCDFLLHAPGIYPFSGPNPEYPLACVIFCHQNIMKPQLWTTNPPKTHKIR